MSISVRINPEKVRQVTIKGAKIKYRSLEFLTLQRMYNRNLVNGELTEEMQENLAIEAMKMMIVGWSGFENEDTGKPLEYKPEYIRSLPSMVLIEFFNRVLIKELEYHGLTEGSARRGEQLKNSGSTVVP